MIDFVREYILEGLFRLTEAIGFPSYAVAIIILTIIVKLILLPLNIKQMRSMKQMQIIQPLMAELDKKYANNPQKKQEEMLKLYQEHQINPMAGCLPLLIQLPIIMVLYRSLLNFDPAFHEYYNFFWISDLSAKDTTMILPILAGAFTFLQSYTSTGWPKDKMQRSMIIIMPIMIIWMGSQLQAGICIYWIVFSIMGILQQIFINRGITPEKGHNKKLQAQAQAEIAEIENKHVKPSNPELQGIKNPNTSKKKKRK